MFSFSRESPPPGEQRRGSFQPCGLTPWGKISRWDLFLQGDSGGGNQSNSGQSGGDANDIVSAGVRVVVSSGRSGNAQGFVREDIGAQGAGLQDEAALIVIPLSVAGRQLAILVVVDMGALFLVEPNSSSSVEGGSAGEVQEGQVGVGVGIGLQNIIVSLDRIVEIEAITVIDANSMVP